MTINEGKTPNESIKTIQFKVSKEEWKRIRRLAGTHGLSTHDLMMQGLDSMEPNVLLGPNESKVVLEPQLPKEVPSTSVEKIVETISDVTTEVIDVPKRSEALRATDEIKTEQALAKPGLVHSSSVDSEIDAIMGLSSI